MSNKTITFRLRLGNEIKLTLMVLNNPTKVHVTNINFSFCYTKSKQRNTPIIAILRQVSTMTFLRFKMKYKMFY